MANNNTERLSSSDSGGSLQHNHNLRRIANDKSTMTINDHHAVRNGYATWNRYEQFSSYPLRILLHFRSSSSSSRPTVLPVYANGMDSYGTVTKDTNPVDPSYRIIRCTSMDTVRRNDQVPPMNSNEKLRTDTLLKQKMCSSKKHSHTPMNLSMQGESLRSHSFSTTANINHQSTLDRHQYQNGDMSIQKPRVYTQDDRSFLGQHQQNLLSSSSASSTLSVKDKGPKEVGETRYQSFQSSIFSSFESEVSKHALCFRLSLIICSYS